MADGPATLPLSDRGLDVPPGERAAGWLTFEGTPEEPVRIPVVILRGPSPGPTVWVQAGLHGDEGDGVVALLRWLEARNPADLAGRVIAIPVVNTPAFLAGSAGHPTGGMNLNRAFTGAGGTWAERFATWLLAVIARYADAFVDLHGGGRSLEVAHFAFAGNGTGDEADDRSRRLAGVAGVQYICAPPPAHTGALYRVLAARSTPAILVEAGGGTIWQEEPVGLHVNALDKVLRALGMMRNGAADMPAAAVAPRDIARTVELWAHDDAVVIRRAAAGTIVRAGEAVVELRALTGEPRPPITSPLPSAVVLSVAASPFLPSGSYACLLGEYPA